MKWQVVDAVWEREGSKWTVTNEGQYPDGKPAKAADPLLLLPAVVWPLALLVLAPREASETYLIMFFCIAAVASSLTAAAAYRPFFLVLVLGMIVPLTVAIGAGLLLPEVPRGLAAMGAVFVGMAEKLRRDLSPRRAMLLFHYSLLYLALIFVALALDAVI